MSKGIQNSIRVQKKSVQIHLIEYIYSNNLQDWL